MEQNMTERFFSADGHVVEPADLWTTRMDKRFRDRAPRVESLPDSDYIIVEGQFPLPVGFEGAMMRDKLKGKIETPIGYRYGDTRPGAWDPQARLADQDLDNLGAEVIYLGPFGLQFYAIHDPEYQRECWRVYNDWLSEYCSVAPKRLFGVGFLPMQGPIEWAIAEAERVAKKGLCSVAIPCVPSPSYSQPHYEPLWAALQDLGLPVALHVGTNAVESQIGKAQRLHFATVMIDTKIISAYIGINELIWGGVPARYPKLRFVIAEGGIGWTASLLGTMDHWWKDHHHWMEPKLDEVPSVYFKRQFWATFEDDRAGLLTRELLNVDHFMWGADYPHTEGVWPRSREQIAKDFAGVPEAEVRKIVADNAARFYGLAL